MKLSLAISTLLALICCSKCQAPVLSAVPVEVPEVVQNFSTWVQISSRLPYLRDFGHVPVSYEKWLVMDFALWLYSQHVQVDVEPVLYDMLKSDLVFRGNTLVEFKVDNRQLALGEYLRSIQADIRKLQGPRDRYQRRRRLVIGVDFADAIWQGLSRVQSLGDDEPRRARARGVNQTNYIEKLEQVFHEYRRIDIHHIPVRRTFHDQIYDFVITWAEIPEEFQEAPQGPQEDPQGPQETPQNPRTKKATSRCHFVSAIPLGQAFSSPRRWIAQTSQSVAVLLRADTTGAHKFAPARHLPLPTPTVGNSGSLR